MVERWRISPSLPAYEVSILGRVRCIPFVVAMPHGGERKYGGRAHSGFWAANEGRYIFTYKGKAYKVATLVCEAFNGPRPSGMVCMHIDENSRNNRASNLKWGTQKENLNAPGFIAYCKSRTGKNSTHAKAKSP